MLGGDGNGVGVGTEAEMGAVGVPWEFGWWGVRVSESQTAPGFLSPERAK